MRGTIALEDCETCSIQINGKHRSVKSTIDSIFRTECGDFEFAGLAPYEDYDLEAVCRSGSDYYFHWIPFTLLPDQNLTLPAISWAKPAYAIRLEGAELLPPKVIVLLRIRDTTTGHAYLLRASPRKQYNIGGIGALKLTYAAVEWSVPGASAFHLGVEVGDATVGAPARVRVTLRR